MTSDVLHASRRAIVFVLGLVVLQACAFEHQPGYAYTNTGQNLGADNWHDIDPGDSKVSFRGDDPVKKREAEVLSDRYRERITFSNNAIMYYSKSYLGGWAATANPDDAIEQIMQSDFYKEKSISFDRSKLKSARYFKYIVASAPNYHCFVFEGIFGEAGIGDYRQGSPGNQEIRGAVCFTAASKTADSVEEIMVGILDRARFGGEAPH